MKEKSNQELKNAQDYISSFLKNWKSESKTQKELVQHIKDYCKHHKIHKFNISAPVLSKMGKISAEVADATYLKFEKILKGWQENKVPNKDIIPEHLPFMHLKGKYEVYHKSRHKDTLLKNILEIGPEGKAFMHSHSNHTHYGEVSIFQETMVAINFHTLNQKDFHYQILMNLKGYLEYGLSKVTHIWAISTTITLEQFPMANLRIICPSHNAHNKLSPENIDLTSPDFQAHLERHPALSVFISDKPSRLLCPYEVNEKI